MFAVSRSTDADQRDLLVPVIASDSAPVRVKGWRAIHQKQIPVMTVVQFQSGHPATIRCAAHGRRCWVPSVEIAYQVHTFNPEGITEKRNVMLLPSREVRPLRPG